MNSRILNSCGAGKGVDGEDLNCFQTFGVVLIRSLLGCWLKKIRMDEILILGCFSRWREYVNCYRQKSEVIFAEICLYLKFSIKRAFAVKSWENFCKRFANNNRFGERRIGLCERNLKCKLRDRW